MSSLSLSSQQLTDIIEQAVQKLVNHLIMERRDDLQLLTVVQASALLHLEVRTLNKLVPRIVISPGQYRYKASDIAAFIEKRREMPPR